MISSPDQLLATTVQSPIGQLTLTAQAGQLTGLYLEQHRHAPGLPKTPIPGLTGFEEPVTQLQAYFAGTLRKFDLGLTPRGTPFQQRVWAQLLQIPYGETISYAELARLLGNPKATRAVGAANGHNPISIIVPCHRVIGADGSLGGYGGGLERKAWLLNHEAAHRGR